jgi:hypothetical protein
MIRILAIALALSGCMECRPGDATTTNGRDLCPQQGGNHERR